MWGIPHGSEEITYTNGLAIRLAAVLTDSKLDERIRLLKRPQKAWSCLLFLSAALACPEHLNQALLKLQREQSFQDDTLREALKTALIKNSN
jgi:succinate dehydrogenase/fumarate reductase-like Fe-S protein